MSCELCQSTGGTLIWSDPRLRVVHVAEPGYAGYCRVIWNAHVREMTDLTEADRAHCMRVVFTVETALRDWLKPEKMNLGSLGNITPHLHWHVIARFRDDPHFPGAAWGAPLRSPVPVEIPRSGFFEMLAVTLSRITGES
jgi:diadenosine tetraphosphate (Ap4A) HIT family hydrolase